MAELLTAEDVKHFRFTTYRHGLPFHRHDVYSADEVDAMLDGVVTTLKVQEHIIGKRRNLLHAADL